MPLQLICVPGHDTLQLPLPQTFPPLHVVPALPAPLPVGIGPQPGVAPQYVGLVFGSMHVPPQSISVPGQETWHVPFAQTFPLLHAVPALPDPPTPQAPLAPQ